MSKLDDDKAIAISLIEKQDRIHRGFNALPKVKQKWDELKEQGVSREDENKFFDDTINKLQEQAKASSNTKHLSFANQLKKLKTEVDTLRWDLVQRGTATLKKVVNSKSRDTEINKDELEMEGYLGLLDASYLYNPDVNVSFDAFANLYVLNRITRFINEAQRTIQLPANVITQINRIRQIISDQRTLGEKVNIAKIAKEMNLTEKRVNELLSLRPTASLDQPIGQDGEGGEDSDLLIDRVAYDSQEDDEEAENQQKIDEVLDIMGKVGLTTEEKNVLTFRYGLNGSSAKKYQEIATLLGMSTSTVKAREQTAIGKIQDYRPPKRKNPMHSSWNWMLLAGVIGFLMGKKTK